VRRRTAELAHRHVPRPFRGDLLLVLAAQDRPADLPLREAATAWSPFVAGEIETHEVAVDHDGMLRPAHVPRIGQVVTERLQQAKETSE
jgi:thioesterase domain-containing protein